MPGTDELRGTPHDLDDTLRPGVRLVQIVLGAAASAVLWWFGAVWWAPLPLAASFVAYELFFWRRRDRVVTLRLTPDALVADDLTRGQHVHVDRAAIRGTDVWRRVRADGTPEAVVRLSVDGGRDLAVRLRGAAAEGPPDPDDVDADAMDALLGGLAGILRAVADRGDLVRQDLEAPGDLLRLKAWAPRREVTRARLWRGVSPRLDLFGLPVDPHDAVLELEGVQWRLRDPDGAELDRGELQTMPEVGGRRRAMGVFAIENDQPVEEQTELPLWILALGGHRVAIPAPLVADDAPPCEPDDHELHTTLPEGAAVVWHLLRSLPSDQRGPVVAAAIARCPDAEGLPP